MKRGWVWTWGWVVVVCLLWSVVLAVSIHPASTFEKYSHAWPRESPWLPSGRDLRLLSRFPIHSRAGPQEYFFTPDVFLRVEDWGPTGPPWLEYRGPPDKYRDPGRIPRLLAAMAAIGKGKIDLQSGILRRLRRITWGCSPDASPAHFLG
jgi:hypothetical protein